jgi:hypothetical protein
MKEKDYCRVIIVPLGTSEIRLQIEKRHENIQ